MLLYLFTFVPKFPSSLKQKFPGNSFNINTLKKLIFNAKTYRKCHILSLSTLTASTWALSARGMRFGVRWKQSGTLGVLVPLIIWSSSFRMIRQSWRREDKSSLLGPALGWSASLAGNFTAAYAPST